MLYLSIGAPRQLHRTIATPEGHAIDRDASGAAIGLVFASVRHLLQSDGMLTLNVPPEHVIAAAIEPALTAGSVRSAPDSS